ncbi:TetR/AcrR family transcriptional regulator [Saccharomonospora cyanea]|uniref:TetR/AcrR family transcriptional regulator n=1 Tax=Saccharomonospora cyanea TaxID=40989 RepID=UPI001E4B7F41|nr:TetR/AcrR family transcriptional regulator [Saccharomonospora cyanea]
MTREYVTDHQRGRILNATIACVAEHGYPDLTVEAIVGAARVSRRTFYHYFRNKEEAFLAAYDDVARRLATRLRGIAALRDATFAQRVEETLRTVLTFFAEHPAEAQLTVVEALAAGPAALRRRHDALLAIVDLVDRSTHALTDGDDPRRLPPITAETVVGGVVEVVYSRVERGETARLPELLPDLAYCVLLPYLGPATAAAEHDRLAGGDTPDGPREGV